MVDEFKFSSKPFQTSRKQKLTRIEEQGKYLLNQFALVNVKQHIQSCEYISTYYDFYRNLSALVVIAVVDAVTVIKVHLTNTRVSIPLAVIII